MTPGQLTKRQHILEGNDVVLWAEAMHALDTAQRDAQSARVWTVADKFVTSIWLVLTIAVLTYLCLEILQ
jgi:hypothetical protein